MISTRNMATLLTFAPPTPFYDEEFLVKTEEDATKDVVMKHNVETEEEWKARNAFLDLPLDSDDSEEDDLPELTTEEFDAMFGAPQDATPEKPLCSPGRWFDRGLDQLLRERLESGEIIIIVETEEDAQFVRDSLKRDAA